MKFKWLLLVLVAVGVVALGEINLKVGDPESQVVATLGQPQGKGIINGVTIYMYDGGTVTAKGGTVIDLPKDFEATAQRKQIERAKHETFIAEQKAKGLILYEKQGVTSEQKRTLEKDVVAAKTEPKSFAFYLGAAMWVIVPIMLWEAVRASRKAASTMISCPNCQYQGRARLWEAGCGPQLLELFLFLCFFFPWIIYKGFTRSKLQCPKCGNIHVVKINMP